MSILKIINMARLEPYEVSTMDFVNSMTRDSKRARGIYERTWGPLIGFFTVLGLVIGEGDE